MHRRRSDRPPPGISQKAVYKLRSEYSKYGLDASDYADWPAYIATPKPEDDLPDWGLHRRRVPTTTTLSVEISYDEYFAQMRRRRTFERWTGPVIEDRKVIGIDYSALEADKEPALIGNQVIAKNTFGKGVTFGRSMNDILAEALPFGEGQLMARNAWEHNESLARPRKMMRITDHPLFTNPYSLAARTTLGTTCLLTVAMLGLLAGSGVAFIVLKLWDFRR
eukprot:gnl/TRDRNA2_/TRDRNA2_135148_c1_seq2.p1 gnl/TRDRNA2_/TRDRNA2_135148_c1~~gnl/TRDRNA2_/TRDRNA2_135148_c1_seq2.p1  ORF type:complete len:222 (+),score=28.44 gnl/TRDRNA2_/TRDRNA2_135148_c1_seq2:264-929(+)